MPLNEVTGDSWLRPGTGTALEEGPFEETRLLMGTQGGRRADLSIHLASHGALPEPRGPRDSQWALDLIDSVERSGLSGRGGGGFPSARKLLRTREAAKGALRPRPIVVVNAMEGEPASSKDEVLLRLAPHLMLDGALAAARAVGATTVIVCVTRARPLSAGSVVDALAERESYPGHRKLPPLHSAGLRVEVVQGPDRFVAGEESALSAWLDSGLAKPTFRLDKSKSPSVKSRPVLVANAETISHLALIARHGAEWFRQVGPEDAPGTALVSVSGVVRNSGVQEVPVGTPVSRILARAGLLEAPGAVLIGGYGGAWISGTMTSVPFSPSGLRALGATPGAGVICAISSRTCGIMESARVAWFMAQESAGQCGPCKFGLPAIADDLRMIAECRAGAEVLPRLSLRLEAVRRRGACSHPDGVARLVQSAIEVFAADIAAHVDTRRCAVGGTPPVLPLRPVARSAEDWS